MLMYEYMQEQRNSRLTPNLNSFPSTLIRRTVVLTMLKVNPRVQLSRCSTQLLLIDEIFKAFSNNLILSSDYISIFFFFLGSQTAKPGTGQNWETVNFGNVSPRSDVSGRRHALSLRSRVIPSNQRGRKENVIVILFSQRPHGKCHSNWTNMK